MLQGFATGEAQFADFCDDLVLCQKAWLEWELFAEKRLGPEKFRKFLVGNRAEPHRLAVINKDFF